MITKMIGALDLPECLKVLEAVELRLLCYNHRGDKDYDYCLKDAHAFLKDSITELKTHYRHSLMDKFELWNDDRSCLSSRTQFEGITYIRSIYPDCSIREAKDRHDLWKETGK